MSISTSCSSHGSFERSGSTWTKFQTQCNLWKRKKTPVSYKLSDASRLNSLFCLCLILKPSKSMAQPDCCRRLTWAEINGIVASGSVSGDRRASMKLSWFHMMSISTSCSSHGSFERSGSTWTKFQTQCNLWKRKKTPVSYKLSDASRLNSLFCLCLIPKPSKSMAQPDCCRRLTWAEINGIVASGSVSGDRRASMKLSWFHMMSISTSCSSHVSFERSGSAWTKFQTQCNLWKRKKIPVSYKLSDASRINRSFSVFVWFPSPPNQWRNRTVAAGWHGPR